VRKVGAATVSTNTSSIDTASKDSSTCAEDSQERSSWKDGISYCTWNGLGWNLSEDKILDALEDLEKSGVEGKRHILVLLAGLTKVVMQSPTLLSMITGKLWYVILVNYYDSATYGEIQAGCNYGSSGTWSSFEANEMFPGGLKGIVSKIRERFPKIKHIGVWHALVRTLDGVFYFESGILK